MAGGWGKDGPPKLEGATPKKPKRPKFGNGHFDRFLDFVKQGSENQMAADAVGWDYQTIKRYLKRYPLKQAMVDDAREHADAQVVSSIFVNATVNMSVAAQIFWVKNRQPDKWKNKIRDPKDDLPTGPVNVEVNIRPVEPVEFDTGEAKDE